MPYGLERLGDPIVFIRDASPPNSFHPQLIVGSVPNLNTIPARRFGTRTSMMYFSALLSPLTLVVSLILLTSSTAFKYPDLDWAKPTPPLTVDVLHQFPVGTWLENLAIRRNGKILTTTLSSGEIFQVDNYGVEPIRLVYSFGDSTGCTGITHLGRDVFYVIAGTFNISTLSAVGGSWSVFRVDVHHHHHHVKKPKPAKVSLVANFSDSILLNGITVLNKYKKWLLVSDSGAGVVYRLEADTGKVVKVLEDPLMKPDNSSGIGVNGIKIKTNQLYFTNTNKNIFARIIIEADGSSKESATVVADIDTPDDFTFNAAHHADVAQNGVDRLGRVIGSSVDTLAGSPSNGMKSELFGPTAVQFGKVKPYLTAVKGDCMKAYISTNGGLSQYVTGNVTRGGTISVVDVRGNW